MSGDHNKYQKDKLDYTKWHSVPPPSAGWWPASIRENQYVLRWWNGECWSDPVWTHHTECMAASHAVVRSIDQQWIKWQHRPKNWPARSRT